MKAITASALLFVILLGALFIYVAEDIPAFGDPYSPANRWVNLSIGIDARNHVMESLNEGVVPDALVSEIKNRGLPLPEGYKVERGGEEEGWKGWDILIPKGEMFYPNLEKYYFIMNEGNRLWVYRYSVPVRWEERCEEETGVPNMVTAGLADYRGYDTLGETTVIFTAGVSVILLLRRRGKL